MSVKITHMLPTVNPVERIEINNTGIYDKKLIVKSNYRDSIKEAKHYYERNKENHVLYIKTEDEITEGVPMGLSIEEAESLVEAISSMIAYIKGGN